MDVRSSLVLFVVLVLILSVAGLGGQDKNLATIHVINSMPKDSEPINLRCSSRSTDHGIQQLRVGDDYQCGVEEKALYFCEAIWGRQMASWHAFQPRRDGNHKAVFWLVKDDGFFHSWHNSSWVRKSEWETE